MFYGVRSTDFVFSLQRSLLRHATQSISSEPTSLVGSMLPSHRRKNDTIVAANLAVETYLDVLFVCL